MATFTTTVLPSAEQIAAWARGVGLPYCVGEKFVTDKGHLPTTLAELVDWGNAKGWRDSQGGWSCGGLDPGPIEGPGPTHPDPAPIIGGGFLDNIWAEVQKNPTLWAVGGAIVGIMVLRRR